MRGLERQKTRVFLTSIQHTIHIVPWKKPLQKWTCHTVVRPWLNFPGRKRTGVSSVIDYHRPESVPVFVRKLFRRSTDQLVVAQPGANARRWERIFWGFHNAGNDVLQEHVRYGDLRLYGV
jgi:hypothetical protein